MACNFCGIKGHNSRSCGARLSRQRAHYRRKNERALEQAEMVGYVLCVVPGCLVRTRTPTADGMCPRKLWDLYHEAYAGQVKVAS